MCYCILKGKLTSTTIRISVYCLLSYISVFCRSIACFKNVHSFNGYNVQLRYKSIFPQKKKPLGIHHIFKRKYSIFKQYLGLTKIFR